MRWFFSIPFVFALLAACDKSLPVKFTYTVTPYVQSADKGTVGLCAGAGGYAFYADTSAWEVTSYEDAEAGVLTSRGGQGTKHFDFDGVQGEDGRISQSPITGQPVMAVVYYPASRSWAVRQVPVGAGIDTIRVSVTFRTWNADSTYTDSKWKVFNAAM